MFVSLDGGIGNLLFQYAAALHLTENHGYDVKFVEVSDGLFQRLESYVGKSPIQMASWPAEQIYAPRPDTSDQRGTLTYRMAGLLTRPATSRWIRDYVSAPLRLPRNIKYLKGYFQHPSWYEPVIEQILSQLEDTASEKTSVVPNDITVVHLRRSDYVRLGWDLPLDYYLSAISNLGLKDGSPIAVFSDDQVVRELFGQMLTSRGFSLATFSGATTAQQDFYRMANARRIVMSNSTFCWWASKLAQRIHGGGEITVVCPQTWLPLSGSDVLIDPTWQRVKTHSN